MTQATGNKTKMPQALEGLSRYGDANRCHTWRHCSHGPVARARRASLARTRIRTAVHSGELAAPDGAAFKPARPTGPWLQRARSTLNTYFVDREAFRMPSLRLRGPSPSTRLGMTAFLPVPNQDVTTDALRSFSKRGSPRSGSHSGSTRRVPAVGPFGSFTKSASSSIARSTSPTWA